MHQHTEQFFAAISYAAWCRAFSTFCLSNRREADPIRHERRDSWMCVFQTAQDYTSRKTGLSVFERGKSPSIQGIHSLTELN